MQDEQLELIKMLEDSARGFIGGVSEDTSSEALWQSMAELGWLGLSIPEQHGGAGLGVAENAALTRLFGQSALMTQLIAQSVMPSEILAQADSQQELVSTLCEQLIGGSKTFAVAWQEKSGQDETATPNTQISDGKLNGEKVFVAGGDNANYLLTSAILNDELVLVVIDTQSTGVTIQSDYANNNGLATAVFKDVSVDSSTILLVAEQAQQALNNSLQAGRITLSAELEGLASGCLEKTVEFVQTRKQFNRVIGSFQAIRHRCVDMLIETRLAESSWRRAVREQTTGQTSSAKSRCSSAAFKVAKESIQMHGAMGFTEEAGIGNYMRAAISRSAWLGSPRQHRQKLLETTNSAGAA